MRTSNKLCAALLAIAWIAPAIAAPPSGMRFRCESDRSEPKYCAVSTREGITLVKQLSRTPCMQGRNWDYDRHGVWVSHRCRAEFIAGRLPAPDAPVAARLLRCGSPSSRVQRCVADTSKGVRLVRLLSASDCVENRDWGHDEDGIWTARGCRAEFSLGPAGGPEAAAAPATRLTCESGNQQRQRCKAVIKHGVDLIRQLSKTHCVEDSNWGWDAAGVWVDQGCRAEFRVR